MRDRTIRDGRSIIVLALLFYFSAYLLFRKDSGSIEAWRRLGVTHSDPGFADMRFILCAIESQREGYDPYQINPRDPWHRAMNYPRLWLLFSTVGAQERHTVPLAIGLAAIFYVSLLTLVGPLTFREGAFYSLLVCSPALMQGVERANVDLLIFSLLTVTVLLIRSQGPRSIWPYSLIMTCSFLKLYPITALVVALRDRSRSVALATIGSGCIMFIGYLFWIRRELGAIVANTWKGTIDLSFGSKVVFLYLDSWVGRPFHATASSIACVAAVITVAILIVKTTSLPVLSKETAASALIGLSIFVAVFALLNNFNYKLIFLIFAVPQMLQWIKSRNSSRAFAFVFLAAMTLAFWMSRQMDPWRFFLKQLMNWCLFGMSMVVLLHFVFGSLGYKRSLDDQSMVS